jgi:hypothetical protein
MSHIADFALGSSVRELLTFYFPVMNGCLDKCSIFLNINYVPFLGILFILLVSSKFKSVRISASSLVLKSLLSYYIVSDCLNCMLLFLSVIMGSVVQEFVLVGRNGFGLTAAGLCNVSCIIGYYVSCLILYQSSDVLRIQNWS